MRRKGDKVRWCGRDWKFLANGGTWGNCDSRKPNQEPPESNSEIEQKWSLEERRNTCFEKFLTKYLLLLLLLELVEFYDQETSSINSRPETYLYISFWDDLHFFCQRVYNTELTSVICFPAFLAHAFCNFLDTCSVIFRTYNLSLISPFLW
jgi:hypothetical protein